jgi:phosphoenolpyruvate synthase/pyruvate phosphate dikinase
MALYDMQQGRYVKGSEQIEQLMQGFADPESFFVDKLSAGIGMIAAAFYPQPYPVVRNTCQTKCLFRITDIHKQFCFRLLEILHRYFFNLKINPSLIDITCLTFGTM